MFGTYLKIKETKIELCSGLILELGKVLIEFSI